MKRAEKWFTRPDHWVTLIILLFSFIFSWWLMLHTFSYNPQRQTMEVATRLWSDFGAHIPLIRSFSMGDNLTKLLHGKMPEYPLFPGEPIRYHFLFFAFVGLLERMGVRIDWALNIPSILGFFLLMSAMYVFAKVVFHSARVGFLSLIFFLFNGSLSFLHFFQKHPFGTTTLWDILKANEFPSFAPWGPGDITAFWNLNIYTNQRHLALAFGLALSFLLICYLGIRKPFKGQLPWAIVWGCIIGLFPFLHQPTLIIFVFFGVCYFLFFPNLRFSLLVTGLIASLLIALQYPHLPHGGGFVSYYPGYLFHDTLVSTAPMREKIINLGWYWFQNLGGHLLFAPIGFILVNNRIKKLFIPLLLLFLFPNLIKLSVEVAANHKFLNFFLIMSSMLSAYTVSRLFEWLRRFRFPFSGFFSYCTTAVILFFLVLSGIIDFFVVANDSRGPLLDVASHPVATWIATNTPPDAVFLNGSWLYNPASIAGRKIILGWPYFPWSAGYNTEKRLADQKEMLEATDITLACSMFRQFRISYVLTEEPQPQSEFTIDYRFYETYFPLLFENRFNGTLYKLYKTTSLCSSLPII